MKTLIITLLLLLNIGNSLAEATDTEITLKEYDVEIIIFEDAHARYINSESWRKSSSEEESLIAENTRHRNKTNAATDFDNIKPVILNKEYKRINNSSEYEVLQYSAWRQTGLKSTDAFEIDINKLDNFHNSQSENTISGKVKVVLARYLHFYSSLEYQRLNDFDGENEDSSDNETELTAEGVRVDRNQNIELTPVNNNYSMESHRRMRSKEPHYIDHPMIGILIQINPVEPALTDQAN